MTSANTGKWVEPPLEAFDGVYVVATLDSVLSVARKSAQFWYFE